MKPNQQLVKNSLVEVQDELQGFEIIHRQSTAIEFIGLNFETGRMYVQYLKGQSYIYDGVDDVILLGARNCPSIGKYVADFIKPSYNPFKVGKLIEVIQEGVEKI